MHRSHGFLSSRSFPAEGSHADNASEMQDVGAEAADITVSQVHGSCCYDTYAHTSAATIMTPLHLKRTGASNGGPCSHTVCSSKQVPTRARGGCAELAARDTGCDTGGAQHSQPIRERCTPEHSLRVALLVCHTPTYLTRRGLAARDQQRSATLRRMQHVGHVEKPQQRRRGSYRVGAKVLVGNQSKPRPTLLCHTDERFG